MLMRRNLQGQIPIPTQTDDYASYVTCLLNFNGKNGDTTFTDAISANVWSAAGSTLNPPTLNRNLSAFPDYPNSYAFWVNPTVSSGGGYFTCPSSANFGFGTGEYTVEMFLLSSIRAGANEIPFAFYSGSTGINLATYSVLSVSQNGVNWCTNIPAGINMIGYRPGNISVPFTHLAIQRSIAGSTAYLNFYVNGITAAYDGNIAIANMGSSLPATLFSNPGGSYPFYGAIGQFRVTKGAARYPVESVIGTPAFYYPSAPFPPP